jgi:hypothetical protein
MLIMASMSSGLWFKDDCRPLKFNFHAGWSEGDRRQFNLDDDALEDLKAELLFSYPAIDQNGRGLVWTGEIETTPGPTPASSTTPDQELAPTSYTPPHLAEKILQSKAALEGERKSPTSKRYSPRLKRARAGGRHRRRGGWG